MKYTKNQVKAMNQLKMSKVIYRNMWKKDHVLGYTSKGKRFYEINIADDIPSDDSKSVVLLHELGHQIYGHFDEVDLKKEMKDVKALFQSSGVPYSMIRKYGGPHSFINIAMDLYINSTFLTPSNCKTLLDDGFKICTIKNFGFEYQSDFRDYYSLMVEKLKKALEQSKKNSKKSEENKDENESEDLEDNVEDSEENESEDSEENESEDSEENESEDSEENEDDYNEDLLDDDCEDNNSLDEIKDLVDSLIKDFTDTVSNIDDEVDEDIQDEIYNENYICGNINSTKDNVIEETDIETYMDDQDVTGGYKSLENLMNMETVDRAIVECDKDEAINKFLSSIVNFGMSYRPDPIRRHNTGTRRNDSGIMYSTIRRRNNTVKKKLGILIDCSGSMDSSSLIKAIKALKDSMGNISPDSVVVAWDFEKRGEWKIKDIPDTMPHGYWTDLSRGVDYLSKLMCDDIIIYSDMATDLNSFVSSMNNYNGNIYSIIVGTNDYEVMKSQPCGKKALKDMARYICIKGETD